MGGKALTFKNLAITPTVDSDSDEDNYDSDSSSDASWKEGSDQGGDSDQEDRLEDVVSGSGGMLKYYACLNDGEKIRYLPAHLTCCSPRQGEEEGEDQDAAESGDGEEDGAGSQG